MSLRELPFFAGLSAEALAGIERRSRRRTFPANELVFRQGDPCDGLYVIDSGGVTVRDEAVGRPIERVRDLAPGEVFGELEVLDGSRRQFSVRAAGLTSLLQVELAPLKELLARYPVVEARLRALVIERRTSRLHSLLKPSTRREPRIRVDRAVVLILEDGSRWSVRLEDLSDSGMCLSRAPAGWAAHQAVSFALGLSGGREILRLNGVVRWRESHLVGIAFAVSEGELSAHRGRVALALAELVSPASVPGGG